MQGGTIIHECSHKYTGTDDKAYHWDGKYATLYRAGNDRLLYQATRAVGALTLVEASPERYLIDAALTLINPEIDLERAGPHQLAGQIVIARP